MFSHVSQKKKKLMGSFGNWTFFGLPRGDEHSATGAFIYSEYIGSGAKKDHDETDSTLDIEIRSVEKDNTLLSLLE